MHAHALEKNFGRVFFYIGRVVQWQDNHGSQFRQKPTKPIQIGFFGLLKTGRI
jgi:hypothetical protein